MAITVSAAPIESQSFPQGDIRDPLGMWGFRTSVAGDATGNPITVTVRVPAAKRSAYVYTCYYAYAGQIVGTKAAVTLKLRLLTNWPNVDPQAGVQAFATLVFARLDGNDNFTAPVSGPLTAAGGNNSPLVGPNDRFILLYDPRQPASLGPLDILEYQLDLNTDATTWTFEAYGYYWDRSVMDAPGGPRHPGAS